jgi:hypothetical protein
VPTFYELDGQKVEGDKWQLCTIFLRKCALVL